MGSTIHFRLSERMLAEARCNAAREGMSMSELMRAALRRELKAA